MFNEIFRGVLVKARILERTLCLFYVMVDPSVDFFS